MFQTFSKLGLAAALCGLMLVPSVTWAQGVIAKKVHDEAGIFSKDTVARANKVIANIKEKHKKDLFIETIEKDKAPPKEERAKWAKQRFEDFAIDGVYVVIVHGKGLGYQFYVGDKTRTSGYFGTKDMDKLKTILDTQLSKNADDTLTEVVNYTLETMNEHAQTKGATTTPAAPKKKAAAAPAPPPAPVVHRDQNHGEGMPGWVGWVCLIVGGLLVVWVVFALIRALTGGMGGGGGYGPGYGGGYGGGGGGFFTSMLGGMFGAMAGMWMYNHFFGGHSTYSDWGMNTPPGHTPTGESVSTTEPYEADTGVGGGGSGGDEDAGGGGGGDAGGGDAGGGGDWGGGGGGDAGGGDWGGGVGDAGGGGDWGGGGGGGGDWGGGGGGDFGGGGGGGGDW